MLTCISTTGFSQSWFEGNPEWAYEYNEWNCAFGQSLGRVNMYYVKDTSVAGLTMKLFNEERLLNKMGDTIVYQGTRLFYEESDQVFLYSHNEMHLIYDFTLEVGDTLEYITSGDPYFCDSIALFVLEVIDTVDINGQSLRSQQWRLQNDSGAHQVIITEKVGQEGNTFFTNPFWLPCVIDACNPYTLLCYYNNQLDLQYQFQTCEDLVLSTVDGVPCDVIVFPNPTIEAVNIQSICSVAEVQVWDLNGKIVTQSSDTRIPTMDIAPGLYYLFVTLDNGQAVSQKLVVH